VHQVGSIYKPEGESASEKERFINNYILNKVQKRTCQQSSLAS